MTLLTIQEERIVAELNLLLQNLSRNFPGLVAANAVDDEGQTVASINPDRQFDEEEMSRAHWQIAREASRVFQSTKAGVIQATITTTDQYIFLIKPIDHGHLFLQIVLRADGDLEAARAHLETIENDSP
jgi:predicted regulator of Ras-like GTPase activity (Roadblock/LC7/MglB family)